MRSIVVVTNEMDDAAVAVQELLDQIESNGPLGKNSCGFVFCDAEMLHEDLMRTIKEKMSFEVVGCTSIANFDTKNGSQILSTALVVLTGDDVNFGVSLTGPLTPQNLRGELEAAYRKSEESAGGRGKLLFLVPPFDDAVPLDEYVDLLSEFSGGIPIFGGLPSSNVADGDILMYADGHAYEDRAAIVMIGGNVRPIFSVQNFLSELSDQRNIVTGAEKNLLRTVEDMTFVDYLRHLGLPVDDLIAQGDLAVYVSNPLKVYMNTNNDHDKIPVARTIKTLNPEDGSGILFGAISENSSVSIVTMKRQDIVDSCKMAMREITEKIKSSAGDGYEYETLLCISCGGRYMVMGDDKDIEGNILTENIPPGVSLAGFYAYGEICPTVIQDGKALNRVHNESIVMCAL
jgi:hypothetical protein